MTKRSLLAKIPVNIKKTAPEDKIFYEQKAVNEIRKMILYIAMSIDGFIADKKGGIEWLEKQDIGPEGQESYEISSR